MRGQVADFQLGSGRGNGEFRGHRSVGGDEDMRLTWLLRRDTADETKEQDHRGTAKRHGVSGKDVTDHGRIYSDRFVDAIRFSVTRTHANSIGVRWPDLSIGLMKVGETWMDGGNSQVPFGKRRRRCIAAISRTRCRLHAFQLHNKVGVHLNAERPADLANRFPTYFSIGAECLTDQCQKSASRCGVARNQSQSTPCRKSVMR